MSNDENCGCENSTRAEQRIAAAPVPAGASSAEPTVAPALPGAAPAEPRIQAIPRLPPRVGPSSRRARSPEMIQLHPAAEFDSIRDDGPRFRVIPPLFNVPPVGPRGPFWAGGSTVFFRDAAGQLLPL